MTGPRDYSWLLPLAAVGCQAGSPASPSSPVSPFLDDGGGADATLDAAEGVESGDDASDAGVEAEAGYAVCPTGIDASFGSIYDLMLQPAEFACGSHNSGCHSTFAAKTMGSMLDFSLDASAVYAELLGDGGGYPARNVLGDAGRTLLRVVPGDADASFLYIKITLPGFDPRYGDGMPLDTPASICPPALDAVRTWIDEGAAR